MTCHLDYVDDPVSKSCYCLRIGNWKPLSTGQKKKDRNAGQCQGAYLILERVEDKDSGVGKDEELFGVFVRIGIGYDDVKIVDSTFANAKRYHLQLI